VRTNVCYLFLLYLLSTQILLAQADSTTTRLDSGKADPVIDSTGKQQGRSTDTVNTADEAPAQDTTTIPLRSGNAIEGFSEPYYKLSFLNDGLPEPDDLNRQTPQATLEHFLLSARAEEYAAARHALNLNLFPPEQQAEKGMEIAKKLHYLIRQRISINWEDLPDRPDGQIDYAVGGNQPLAGQPRRSIVFGNTSLGDREISFRVQRVRIGNDAPVWVISPQTVENIGPLYDQYGPQALSRIVPEWANVLVIGIPVWKLIGVILLGMVCYLISILIYRAVRKIFFRSDVPYVKGIASYIGQPAGLAIGALLFYLAVHEILSLAGTFSRIFYTLVLITVVVSFTWLLMRTSNYLFRYVLTRKVDDDLAHENADVKRHLTYISVARRVITFIIIVVGAGVIFSQFKSLERLGISLLASAGVATVLIGIAAHSTLGNIISGLQIAVTKPVKIGDSVYFEENWGMVEDIRFTYLVIRTWDWRRMVVPLKYFISRPIENWSMSNSHLIQPIYFYTDYKIDVSKVRSTFKELVEASDDWDGKVWSIQVTDVKEDSLEIRATCSSKDPATAWTLHCDLREKMMAYIAQMDGGRYLARQRTEVRAADGDGQVPTKYGTYDG